jgi:hypothetical protein
VVFTTPSSLDNTLLVAATFAGFPLVTYGFLKVVGEAPIWKRLDLPFGLTVGLAVLIWGLASGRPVPLTIFSALPLLPLIARRAGRMFDLPREQPVVWGDRARTNRLSTPEDAA